MSPRPMSSGPQNHLRAIGLALLLVAILSGSARAAEDLDKEMGVVAGGIKQLLDGRMQDAIAVGEFTGPARTNSSGGPGIKLALIKQLEKSGVRVSRRAELEVKGDYLDVVDKETTKIALRLRARVIDRAGNEITHFDRGLFNLTTIASLIGLTAVLPPNAKEEVVEAKLADAIENPQGALAGTRISAGPGSPYAIEVLVKSGGDYRPRAASKDSDEFMVLKIQRDEIYAVKLINDSPYDAAVTLTIDGLSCFAFSETPSYTHWIVPSKRTLVVPGWHRTNRVSNSFKVTEYAKSAVAQTLPSSTSVGTITAGFAAAWEPGKSPPPDETGHKPGERSGDATGKGPPVETNFTEVLRDIGRLRESVSVRYTKDDAANDRPKP